MTETIIKPELDFAASKKYIESHLNQLKLTDEEWAFLYKHAKTMREFHKTVKEISLTEEERQLLEVD